MTRCAPPGSVCGGDVTRCAPGSVRGGHVTRCAPPGSVCGDDVTRCASVWAGIEFTMPLLEERRRSKEPAGTSHDAPREQEEHTE